jgi:hypothetical protein
MENERITLFNDKEVSFSLMVLSDSNKFISQIANSICRLVMGEDDLFIHWSAKDFSYLQEIMCKYVKFVDTGKNLNLFDISENLGDFIGLQFEFLEFNYKVFSQSRKIMSRINGRLLETKETKGQN